MQNRKKIQDFLENETTTSSLLYTVGQFAMAHLLTVSHVSQMCLKNVVAMYFYSRNTSSLEKNTFLKKNFSF